MTSRDEPEVRGGRAMGRKATVPYALYRAHGFISPALAAQTGFTGEDLDVLWQAFEWMFEHDRSAARGLMSLRRMVVFRHPSALGAAPAHRLFDLVRIERRDPVRPPRHYADYAVTVAAPPAGIEVDDRAY